MSEMHGHQRPSDTVPQQDHVEDLIDDVAGEAAEAAVDAAIPTAVGDFLEAASTQAAISDLSAPSAGYVEAEALAMTNAINDILGVLRDAGLIPSA